MLSKSQRKKFRERNWEHILNANSNPSQTWGRLRTKANTALRDLGLIAEKLPDQNLQEIFSDANIEGLILRLLKFAPVVVGVPVGGIRHLDSWRTQLSSSLMEKSMYFCISQYELLEEESPSLAETNIGLLKQSVKICKQIASAVELRELKSKGMKNELTYLFAWDKIPGSDERKLEKFLVEELAIGNDFGQYELEVHKLKNGDQLSCWITFKDESYGCLSTTITLESPNRAVAIHGTSREGEINRQLLKVEEKRGKKFIYKLNRVKVE